MQKYHMSEMLEFIKECQEKVFSGIGISSDDVEKLFNISDENIKELARAANQITRDFNGNKVDVEQLNNIKKNACNIIREINNKVGINVECSLGFLTSEQAKKLKELNVKRYNHNLETSKSKFSEICTTHTYDDRLKTLQIARDAGLELCTGGIIGLGETRKQRLELALELAILYPEEVTINILVPIPGTPLELQTKIENSEIVRMFSVIRFLLPESVIKISGGRETNLEDSGEELLQSGANGIITSGYLTMGGNDSEKDFKMIKKIGLEA